MPKTNKHNPLIRATAILLLGGFLAMLSIPALTVINRAPKAFAQTVDSPQASETPTIPAAQAQPLNPTDVFHSQSGKSYIFTNPSIDQERELSGNGQVQGAGTDLIKVVVRTGTVATRILGGWTGNLMFRLESAASGLVKTTVDSITGGFVLMIFNWLVGDDFAVKVMDAEGRADISFESTMMSPGLLALSSQGVGAVYSNPPVLNTAHVLKDNLATNLLNPEPAYAADSTRGFSFYEGSRQLWERSLTFSLGLALVIMVLVGFSIMFSGTELPIVGSLGLKNKIQITTALPQIFFALFFAVFSLTIAAVSMDTVNVLGSVVISQFPTPGIFEDIATSTNDITINNTENLTQGHKGYLYGGVGPLTVAKLLFWPTLQALFALHPEIIAAPVNPLFLAVSPDPDIFGIVIAIAVLLYILYKSLSIFFGLVKRYLMLYISVIFAPPIMILAALPGQQGLINNWFRSVIVNSAVFPAILIALHIGYFLIEQLFKIPFADPFSQAVAPNFNPFTGQLFFIALTSMAVLHVVSEIPGYMDSRWGGKGHPLFSGMGKTYDESMKNLEKAGKYVQKPVSTITDKLDEAPGSGLIQTTLLKTKFGEQTLQPWLKDRLAKENKDEKDRGKSSPTFASMKAEVADREKNKEKREEAVAKIAKANREIEIPMTDKQAEDILYQQILHEAMERWNRGDVKEEDMRSKYQLDPMRYAREYLQGKNYGLSLADIAEKAEGYTAEVGSVPAVDPVTKVPIAGTSVTDSTKIPQKIQEERQRESRRFLISRSLPLLKQYRAYEKGVQVGAIDDSDIIRDDLGRALKTMFKVAATGGPVPKNPAAGPINPGAALLKDRNVKDVLALLSPGVLASPAFGGNPENYARKQLLSLGYTPAEIVAIMAQPDLNVLDPNIVRQQEPRRPNP